MIAFPAVIPLTNPLASTVATALFPDNHGFVAAGVPEPVNCVVSLEQITFDPKISGAVYTVNTVDTTQPFVSVYVIVDTPCEIAETNPFAFTVATAGFEEFHVFADGLSDMVNCDVVLIQVEIVPPIVGSPFTVTVAVTGHPLAPI